MKLKQGEGADGRVTTVAANIQIPSPSLSFSVPLPVQHRLRPSAAAAAAARSFILFYWGAIDGVFQGRNLWRRGGVKKSRFGCPQIGRYSVVFTDDVYFEQAERGRLLYIRGGVGILSLPLLNTFPPRSATPLATSVRALTGLKSAGPIFRPLRACTRFWRTQTFFIWPPPSPALSPSLLGPNWVKPWGTGNTLGYCANMSRSVANVQPRGSGE